MQVSLPGVHITIGVLLEQDCHQLDLQLAKRTAPISVDRESFAKYAKDVSDLASLEDIKQTNDTVYVWGNGEITK